MRRYYFHFRDGQLMQGRGRPGPAGQRGRVAAGASHCRRNGRGGKHPSAAVSDGVQTQFEGALTDLMPVADAARK